MRLLVGGLLGQHVVPAVEQPQQVDVLAPGGGPCLVGPRFVEVVGQQLAGVPAQCLAGECLVAALEGPGGGPVELADVDLDVVTAGEE